ncbi:MAG: hypothetical protein ABI769_09600 [Pseudomonadota bacterium]
MTNRIAIRLAIAASLAFTSGAFAQALEVKSLPASEINSAECKSIKWQPEMLARFPRIAEACQEVLYSKGAKFARFTGSLVKVNADGSVKIDFKDRAGGSVGVPTLDPAIDQRVVIDGRRLKFSELKTGSALNFYVPESRFAIATELDAGPTAMARIVPEPDVAPAVSEKPALVARTSFQPVATMPNTASAWPWIAVGGILSLLGAVAMFARRRLLVPLAA